MGKELAESQAPSSEDAVDNLPDRLTEDKIDIFRGIAAAPVADEQWQILKRQVEADDVEIRPDGLIYLPEIKYRRVLNETFRPGGWSLMPLSKPEIMGNSVTWAFALYVDGRYFATAVGEKEYFADNPNMSYATCAESAKSNAMMRCCKDLGIASDLWNPVFIRGWKKKYTVEVWCENKKTNKRKKLWRKKAHPPIDTWPWKEDVDNSRTTPPASPPTSGPTESNEPFDWKPNQSQLVRLFTIARKAGWTDDGLLKEHIYNEFNLDSTKDISSHEMYQNICDKLAEGP